jgi:hypothetical protein
MTEDFNLERSENECNEVKGVALNLQHSSENCEFWDSADPIVLGAGHAVSTL